MTPTSHNKTLGILHLAYAGLMTVLMAAMSIFMLAMISRAETGNNNGEPVGFLVFMAIVFVLIALLYAVPSFLAGYALLKRKRWARTMALIAAIVAGMNLPLGAALCVSTLYFLFGESGRLLYPQTVHALPPGEPAWASTTSHELVREYVPPSAPPDWR